MMETDGQLIERLQTWFSSMCNGDWEHTYGIRIQNLDNPGWELEVDLNDTELEDIKVAKTDFNIEHPTDWAFYMVKDGKFTAAGGPKMLGTIISLFLEWIDKNTPSEN